jgi:hypothetical protein
MEKNGLKKGKYKEEKESIGKGKGRRKSDRRDRKNRMRLWDGMTRREDGSRDMGRGEE